MDVKLAAARGAIELLEAQQIIGLGEGSTIAHLVVLLAGLPGSKDGSYVSSSEKTRQLLADAGLPVVDVADLTDIDIYFDGCDQVDQSLNALKSGAGIHTMEKLLATMAREFIVLADETKYVAAFDGKHPLVLECIAEAVGFVTGAIGKLAPGTRTEVRRSGGKPVLTKHGNLLLNAWLPEWNAAPQLAERMKELPGVLETSLFVGLAQRAVIAGERGTRIVFPA